MIREVIREAMQLRKVKAKDLAEYIGITKSTMSLFLNGKTKLGQDKLEAIFEFLEIKLILNR